MGGGGLQSSSSAATGDQNQGSFSVGNMTFGSNGVKNNSNTVLFAVAGAVAVLYFISKAKK